MYDEGEQNEGWGQQVSTEQQNEGYVPEQQPAPEPETVTDEALAELLGDQPAEDQASEAESEPEIADTEINHSRSTTALFSWRDVSLVSAFVLRYSRLSPAQRTAFQEVLDVYGDPVDLAQALYSPGDRLLAFRFVSDIVTRVSAGTLTFMEGVQIGGQLGEMDPETIRAITRAFNALNANFGKAAANDGPVSIRYTKRVPSTEVLNYIMSVAIPDLTDQAAPFLEAASALIDVWPGGNV